MTTREKLIRRYTVNWTATLLMETKHLVIIECPPDDGHVLTYTFEFDDAGNWTDHMMSIRKVEE